MFETRRELNRDNYLFFARGGFEHPVHPTNNESLPAKITRVLDEYMPEVFHSNNYHRNWVVLRNAAIILTFLHVSYCLGTWLKE
jgi:hypothetical protein